MNLPTEPTVQLLQIDAIDEAMAAQIDQLARHAVEPNPFYESWYLHIALAFLPVEGLQMLTVRDASGELILLLPLARRARFKRLPMRTLRSWLHDYAFLAAPLVSEARVQEAIDGLLDWFISERHQGQVIELVDIRMDGAIAAALDGALQRRPQLLARRTQWSRAMHRLDEPEDPQHMSPKQRSSLRRKERRLADEGEVNYRMMAEGDDPMQWIEDFLAVEASGWKGHAGTAMAASESGRAFFVAACQAAHARGQLHMLMLDLDGVPIAMKCNFLSADHAFTFKIAYDETYAKHSPGLLIELFQMECIRDTHPQLVAVDSCTVADNTMFPNLWPGRCTLGDLDILRNNIATRSLLQAEKLRRRWIRRQAAAP